ncbi:MAG: GNAT family N-acetyltransferase [Bacteroidales bacterium]|nr:GNAT family N-acetyltransferase [Bacteroidales bacterium]
MIRRADKHDIKSLMALLGQVAAVHHGIRPDLFRPGTTKYTEKELEALLDRESSPVFVYDEGGKILGHAFCQLHTVVQDRLLQDVKTLYIDDICVEESARGRHVGQALLDYVRGYARAVGCYNITLNVWEGNGPALSFYRNMGMKVQKTGMEEVL